MVERLNISSITFIDCTNDNCFFPEPLDDHVVFMINKFIRATEYRTKDMLITPKKIEHINIVSLLNTSFFNNYKEDNISRYNYHQYKTPEQLKNMENDFKIKYVVPFINAAFDINDSIVIYWDAPLNIFINSNMNILKKQTVDAKFQTVDGIEIGVIGIKPFNTPFEKIEEDRIRLAEISKKMLHKRVLAAKSKKELYTFAIMISGTNVEYFVHDYDPESAAKKYSFRLLKTSTLPTFLSTFTRMTLSLECLLHFKKMMVESIASFSDVEKQYIYSDSYKEFNPTVTLLKLSDE